MGKIVCGKGSQPRERLKILLHHNIWRDMQALVCDSDLVELVVGDSVGAVFDDVNDRIRPQVRANQELPPIDKRHPEDEMPPADVQIIGRKELQSSGDNTIIVFSLG